LAKQLFLRFRITILVIAFAYNCNAQTSQRAAMSIVFNNYVENDILKLDSVIYKTDLEQTYTVTKFKYYISNIHLIRSDGKECIIDNYFLIDEGESDSKTINLNDVPSGEYRSISFIVGVDSLHNCNGAQSGALDPANGMFWAWNTGYIFLKLEGRSSFSTSPGSLLEYHIGGYMSPSNCIQAISLKLENPINIENKKKALINIKTNVAEIFKTPSSIDISSHSAITDLHNASMIADNYRDMFSIMK